MAPVAAPAPEPEATEETSAVAQETETENIMKDLNGEKTDCVILDPTRLGTDERFIKACKKLSPEKIVYISCNPETLSRDIKLFEKYGYHAVEAEPVDMFPWTSSIETVVLLTRTAA